ncbi:diacylglycerol/lipid kinase family protein [Polymorphobacter sp.]|uniref:diacylglycerol/lipid kinase family protein n=1 Tax=Polymorphobacter sp. TaxID=1909290 RepID=UPI003F6EB7E3
MVIASNIVALPRPFGTSLSLHATLHGTVPPLGRSAAMKCLWFVTNVNSGTATHEKCEAMVEVFARDGLILAGRTAFPDEPLPDPAVLEAAGVDTLVLFAGDGTVNATLCHLAGWQGMFLILPGGTMNLLAKSLHDSLDPHAIIAAAQTGARPVALPYIEAGPHRAFVGLIIGPAASWYLAREAVRANRLRTLLRAVRLAWGRTFGRGVRIAGASRLRRGYQAVFVTPGAERLQVRAVDARGWGAIAELGWKSLTDEMVAARAVDAAAAAALRVKGRRPVLALFDGEPVMLEPGIDITGGLTRKAFLATRHAPESAE